MISATKNPLRCFVDHRRNEPVETVSVCHRKIGVSSPESTAPALLRTVLRSTNIAQLLHGAGDVNGCALRGVTRDAAGTAYVTDPRRSMRSQQTRHHRKWYRLLLHTDARQPLHLVLV